MLRMLGDRLRTARDNAHLTQDEAAEAIGLSRSAVAQWETGKTKPGHANLIAAAKAYGVSIEWLLGREPEGEVVPPDSSAAFCDRAITRRMAVALYNALESERLVMPSADDFAELLLTLHDWAVSEMEAGKPLDLDRVGWFARIAKARART